MASSSTSSIQKSFKYDVFLSFRGEDTRKNFVDHLYAALRRQGIHTYKDDERIEKGKRISDELVKSIEDSKFFIIVFSKNFVSSSWCLIELVKIMECLKMNEHSVYPVFYDVEPSEVRKQSRVIEKAFAKHKLKETAGKWREALEEATNLAGWVLKNTSNGHEARFIQKIVEQISLDLHLINLRFDEKLVGMETRIKDVMSILETGFDDVRMIGIKGMGGGGKTTLARAVFDQISIHFEGKSFVENVREVSKAPSCGLKSLQKQVLFDVLNDQGIIIRSVHDGKSMLKMRMFCKKVLVVLDDVDHIDQLEALAGEPNWFKPGSRIIITTRDEQVLIAHQVQFICDVNLLSYEEATSLFCRYAFGKEIPVQGYEELSGQVVRYAAGLPLTVRVLGSFLCGKNELDWKDALERLKTIPLKETLEKLKISYIGLEDDYKEIFLDVACILKGERKDDAIRALESCGFHARNGLRVLEQKSLITVTRLFDGVDEYLGMHDHIKEMGRNIVVQEHLDDPSRRSRLWIRDEIEDVFVNNLGTEATRCIKLQLARLSPEMFMNGLGSIKKLRFLHVSFKNLNHCFHSDWKFDDVSQYFPNALRYLNWKNYPYRFLPKSFVANNLVALKMPYSKIEQLWEGGERKVLKKLRFLDLHFSNLTTLDLRQTPNLETLNLDGCNNLVEIAMPDVCRKLRSLNLSHSKLMTISLGPFPNLEILHLSDTCDDIFRLVTLDLSRSPNLETLTLHYCDELVELHMPINGFPKLIGLKVTGSKLSSLDLRLTPNLEVLELKECYDLEKLVMPVGCSKLRCLDLILKSCLLFKTLPKDLCRLKCLEMLSLSDSVIKHVPESICMLKYLKTLKLESCRLLKKLPKDLGRLQCLENLILIECSSLRYIPNSICKIKCLKNICLPFCTRVEKLPDELGKVQGLKELNVKGTGINYLPHSLFRLRGLHIVGLNSLFHTYIFSPKIPTSEHVTSTYI